MPTIKINKTSTPTKFQKYCEKLINRYFEQMTEGKLKLIKPSGEVYIYGKEKSADSATIEISSYEFYTKCLLYGDIGFGDYTIINCKLGFSPYDLLTFDISFIYLSKNN